MPHECPHCGRVFSCCTALRNHIKTYGSRIDRILEKIAEESTQQASEEEVRNVDEQNDPNDPIESEEEMNYEDQEMIIREESEEELSNAEEELNIPEEEMIIPEESEEELNNTEEELNNSEEEMINAEESEEEEELIDSDVQVRSLFY